MLQVFYPHPASEEIPKQLESLCEDAKVRTNLADVPQFVVLIEGRPNKEMVESSPTLRAVIAPFAGVPRATLSLLREYPDISLHNLHHNAADTAELASALMLACSKLIVPLDMKMRKGNWSPRYEPSRSILLDGKTALVLGYGHIGRHIAKVCRGFGMNVLALRRSLSAGERDGEIEIYPLSALPEMLPRANVLHIALPETPDTIGFIGHRELMLLPKDAILVNIARGSVVDEEALYVALEQGKLHSAGIDVWYQYPTESESNPAVTSYFHKPDSALHTFPSRFPFQDLENVVMSPHRGGVSQDSEAYRVKALAEMLCAASDRQDIPNRVDLDRGY